MQAEVYVERTYMTDEEEAIVVGFLQVPVEQNLAHMFMFEQHCVRLFCFIIPLVLFLLAVIIFM